MFDSVWLLLDPLSLNRYFEQKDGVCQIQISTSTFYMYSPHEIKIEHLNQILFSEICHNTEERLVVTYALHRLDKVSNKGNLKGLFTQKWKWTHDVLTLKSS